MILWPHYLAAGKNKVRRYLNILLRITTLGARFLFVLALAKFLDPAQVGLYGLFTASIGYTLYFVGLDFYTYVTREILRHPEGERGRILKAQAALSGCLYVIVLPVSLVLLIWTDMPALLIWWFTPILILEHFNQEVSRLLIALSRQITASIVLFLRQASWAIAAVVLMALEPESRSLATVLALWSAAGLAAALLGAWAVSRLDMGRWRAAVDWRWVKQGIKVSLGFLAATIALRSVQTFDRYWLEAIGGLELVGAYVLFMGVAGSLLTFLDAGVFAFTYPDLIRHNHQQEHDLARALVRRSLLQTVAVAAAFSVVSVIALPYLLRWIANPVYQANIWLYPWLLTAMIVNAIGLIPHYGLYARGRDKPIILSHLAALGAFVAATWLLSASHATLAVPIGLNVAFVVILIWKTAAYLVMEFRRTGAGVILTP